jgi:hypothetical protein
LPTDNVKPRILDLNESLYGEREAAYEKLFRNFQSKTYLKAIEVVDRSCDLDPDDYGDRQPLDMVSTGIPSIDHILGGGISEGQSIGVGGVYGGGKSVLLLQIATNLAKRGASILYATPELSVDEIYARAASRYALEGNQAGFEGRSIPSFGEIRRMRGRDGQSLGSHERRMVKSALAAWKGDVADRFTFMRFREGDDLNAIFLGFDLFYETNQGGNLKVVVLDPIQRLVPFRPEDMSDIQFDSIMKSEHERIALVATQIKDFVDDNDNTVVLFGSDANAAITNPSESASAGFRGGAKVGNAATTMLFIHKPRVGETYAKFMDRVVGESGFVLAGDPCMDSGGNPITEEAMAKQGLTPTVIATFKNREGPGGFMGMHLHGACSTFIDCAKMEGLSAPDTILDPPTDLGSGTNEVTNEPEEDFDAFQF